MERQAVRLVYFRDFYLDFMGLTGFCDWDKGKVRRTVPYADTILQAYVQAKASVAN